MSATKAFIFTPAYPTNPWPNPGLRATHVGACAGGYAGITQGLIGLDRIGSLVATLTRPWSRFSGKSA
jgi:hypothetical protein